MSPTDETIINSMPRIAEYQYTRHEVADGLYKYDSIIPDDKSRDSFQKVLDLTVVYANAAEEAKKRTPVFGDNLPVADFSTIAFVNFPSTGDPSQDYAIQLNFDYKKSCFEGPTVTGDILLQEINKTEDLSGMTAEEKYKAIYEKYQKCYGENFLYAECAPIGHFHPSFRDSYDTVVSKFNNEIKEVFGKDCNAAKLRRKALYPDMSDTEIMNAIAGKFNTDDGITLVELNQMAYEMKKCGIDGGMHNAITDTDAGTNLTYRQTVLHENIPYQTVWDMRTNAMYSKVTSKDMEHFKASCERMYPGCGGSAWSFLNSLVVEANGSTSGKSLMQQFEDIKGLKL